MVHFVYITINTVNGKFYIGKHFYGRNSNSYLGSGSVIKSAIKKYGKDNFIRVIIKEFEDEKSAFRYEYLLTKYCHEDRECYNMRVGGDGAMSGAENHMWGKTFSMPDSAKKAISRSLSGRELSLDHKKRISKSLIGNKNSAGTKRVASNKKPVLQFDINGGLICRFNSVAEANMSLGRGNVSNGMIQKCASGKSKSGYGFLWEYDKI